MDDRGGNALRRSVLQRSVFFDLFDAEEAIELEGRATLLHGLARWLANSGMTQIKAAKALGTSPARVGEIKRGRLSRFDLNALFGLAAKVGLHPTVQLAGRRFGPKSGAKRRAGRGIG